MKIENKNPIGIRICGIFHILSGILLILALPLLLLLLQLIPDLINEEFGDNAFFGWLMILVSMIALWGLGLFFIISGWGLLKKKPWARVLAMATYFISFFINLLTYILFMDSIIFLVIFGVLLFYFNSDNIKLIFSAKPLPSGSNYRNKNSMDKMKNSTSLNIAILGMLHILIGNILIVFLGFGLFSYIGNNIDTTAIPKIIFFSTGLFFNYLGWGLLKMKVWAKTLTIATYSVFIIINLLFLPDSLLYLIIFSIVFGIIVFSLNTSYQEKTSKEYFDQLIEKAEYFVKRNKINSAYKIYNQIINDLGNQQLDFPSIDALERNVLLGKSYFALGNINILENNDKSAFDNYKKAKELDFPFDENAISLLGHYYAQEGNISEDAIETYFEYLNLEVSRTSDLDINKIYSLLEIAGKIDESSNAVIRKQAINLNNKIIDLNSNLEWAQFNLGIGYYLEGDFDMSINHLKEAQKLNPNRDSIHYYLGKTYLKNDAFENALSAFHDSLLLNPDQADASFQIGKILIDELEEWEP